MELLSGWVSLTKKEGKIILKDLTGNNKTFIFEGISKEFFEELISNKEIRTISEELSKKYDAGVLKIKEDLISFRDELRSIGIFKGVCFRKSKKIFKNYKCDTPENTIKRIEEGFDRISMKLEYVETFSDGNTGLSSGQVKLMGGFLNQFGKGETYLLSKASAYSELAERCSEHLFNRNLLEKVTDYGSYYDPDFINRMLRGKNISQIRNIKESMMDKSCLGYSISSGSMVKVPLKLVRFLFGTTGLASGNSIEEAISQAACELFERYCAITILRSRKNVPTIETRSIKNRKIRRIIKVFENNNITVKVKDFTLGNRFPVIGVLFINNNLKDCDNRLLKNHKYMSMKFGSHPDLDIALMRCFTERIQGEDSIRKIKSGTSIRYDKSIYSLFDKGILEFKEDNSDFADWFHTSEQNYQSFSFLGEDNEIIDFSELKSMKFYDCLDEIDYIKEICSKNGYEMIFVDHTHSLIRFPVARVIIPEMHFLTEAYSLNLIRRIRRINLPFTHMESYAETPVFPVHPTRITGDSFIERLLLKKTYSRLRRWLSSRPILLFKEASRGHMLSYYMGLDDFSLRRIIIKDMIINASYCHLLFWLSLSLGLKEDSKTILGVLIKTEKNQKIISAYEDMYRILCDEDEKYYDNIIKIGLKNNLSIFFLRENVSPDIRMGYKERMEQKRRDFEKISRYYFGWSRLPSS